jgi:hypothetical protein
VFAPLLSIVERSLPTQLADYVGEKASPACRAMHYTDRLESIAFGLRHGESAANNSFSSR